MSWFGPTPSQYQYEVRGGRAYPAEHTTSWTEIWQILVAFVVLSFDMVLILTGFGVIYGTSLSYLASAATSGIIAVAVAATLTGFLAHEMAHKFVAQRLGAWAEFRLSWIGLLMSVVIAYLTGFLLAAPGATVVGGMDYSDREGWGKTALAGPASNACFAVAFFAASVVAAYGTNGFLLGALLFLAYINAWFGVFNLIPVGALDGRKVLRWSTGVWVSAFVALAVLTVIMFTAFAVGSPFIF